MIKIMASILKSTNVKKDDCFDLKTEIVARVPKIINVTIEASIR